MSEPGKSNNPHGPQVGQGSGEDTKGKSGCGCGRRVLISPGDLLAPAFTIAELTEGAFTEETSCGRRHGQDLDECPTTPLGLVYNTTGRTVQVAGDLVVDPESCPVLIVFKEGEGNAQRFLPGFDMRVIFDLAPNYVLQGLCEESTEKKHCKWSFTPTSP